MCTGPYGTILCFICIVALLMFDCWGCNYLGGGIVELNEEAAGRSEGTGSIFPHIASPYTCGRAVIHSCGSRRGMEVGVVQYPLRSNLGGGGIVE